MGRFPAVIVGLFFFYVTIGTSFSLYIPKSLAASDHTIVIPGEAIRLRILANSNNTRDQAVKHKIRDAVNEQITEWVYDLATIEEARTVLIDHLDEIEMIVHDILQEEGMTYTHRVEFARVPFPTKLYGKFLYPAGEYEAILITLGAGTGANWWCVLFPPLCFLDFSTGSAVSPGFEDEVEINQDHDKHIEKTNEESVPEEAKEEKDNKEPVLVEEEEVEIKFFVVELWEKILALF